MCMPVWPGHKVWATKTGLHFQMNKLFLSSVSYTDGILAIDNAKNIGVVWTFICCNIWKVEVAWQVMNSRLNISENYSNNGIPTPLPPKRTKIFSISHSLWGFLPKLCVCAKIMWKKIEYQKVMVRNRLFFSMPLISGLKVFHYICILITKAVRAQN